MQVDQESGREERAGDEVNVDVLVKLSVIITHDLTRGELTRDTITASLVKYFCADGAVDDAVTSFKIKRIHDRDGRPMTPEK